MVPPGIEPGTHGFSVHCSTNWAKVPYKVCKYRFIFIIRQNKFVKFLFVDLYQFVVMNLTLDIGNTHSKLAVFDDKLIMVKNFKAKLRPKKLYLILDLDVNFKILLINDG